MYRAAAILIAIIPLAINAQNEPTAGGRPDYVVERERSPELDVEQALRQMSVSDEERIIFIGSRITGLEGVDEQRFREISVRARSTSEAYAKQGLQQLCNDRENLISPTDLVERLVALTEGEQAPWDEAVSEVFETFPPEVVNSVIRTTATWSYSRFDTDYAMFFQAQEPEAFLEHACALLASAIENGEI